MSAPEAILAYVNTRDHRLMRRVNRWPAPRWIRLWMLAATRGGDGWIWCALAVAVWLRGGENEIRAISASTLAAGAGIAVFIALKRATGRRRPCHYERHCWAKLLPPDQFSFPSGHTITAFAIITPLCCYHPQWSVPLGVLGLSIAASRILLGMHFLSDVIAGAALGALMGGGAYSLLS